MSSDSSLISSRLDKALIAMGTVALLSSALGAVVLVTAGNIALSQLILGFVVVGLTIVGGFLALRDRARRELTPTRVRGFHWLTAGFVVLYGLPAVGLIVSGLTGGAMSGSILKAAMFAAVPFLLAAVVKLQPEVAMTRPQRRIALLDSLIALLSFLAILAQFGRDDIAASDRPWLVVAVMVAQALGCAGAVWLITRNQFAPLVGAAQLWLWWLWALLFIVSDLIAGQVGVDEFSLVLAFSVIGSCVGGWCCIAAAMRPAEDAGLVQGETDPVRLLRRERWSRIIPLTPPLLAVLLLGSELARGDEIGKFALIVAVAATSLLIVLLVVVREGSIPGTGIRPTGASHANLVESTEQQWFKALVNESNDVVTLVDVQGRVGYQAPSVTRVLGHPPASWVGHPFLELVAADDREAVSAAIVDAGTDQSQPVTVEIGLLSRAGGYIQTESIVSSVVDPDGSVSGYVVTSRDVTDSRRMRELLDARAESDSLTGLANLAALRRDINRALAQSEPDTVGVITIDINGFRAVNDSRGHHVGDEVLSLVAEGLARCVRPWDVVSRVGGDEFGILVVGHQIDRSATLIFERIQRFLSGLVLSDGSVIPMSASAGYSVNDRGHEGGEELLRNADLALSRARTTSHMEILRFEHHMHDALLRRVEAENQLRQAFANNEFVMYFQPIVRLPSRRITGAEALLRWKHPERGLLSAYEFIQQIDDLGLGGQLRAMAVDRAVAALAAITKQHPYDDTFNLSFNISADQLTGQLLDDLAVALDQHGAPPTQLTVEVTESAIASVQEATSVLERISALGLKIAIDDFGVGYSSLGYLAHFPVDYIKIDRSFVQGIDSKPNLERLTEAIVVLGEALSSPPVVEGVETEAELEAMIKAGARYAQGWLFAKAMPLSELLSSLDRQGEYGPDSSSSFAQQPLLDFASES